MLCTFYQASCSDGPVTLSACLSACPACNVEGGNNCAELPIGLWAKSFQLRCLLLCCWLLPLSQSLAPPSLGLDISLQLQHLNPVLAALSPQHILLISGIITATYSSPATQRQASHQWPTREHRAAVSAGQSLEV